MVPGQKPDRVSKHADRPTTDPALVRKDDATTIRATRLAASDHVVHALGSYLKPVAAYESLRAFLIHETPAALRPGLIRA